MFFKDCKCIEDLKKAYYKLALENHPDKGGDEEVMKRINAEYEKAFNLLKDVHRNAEGKTYEKTEKTTETPEEYASIINNIIHMDGVKIEIIGAWIWCSENTLPYKEQLKELKFRWSNNKQAWYYHNDKYKRRSNKNLSMNDIRDLFGSEEVATKRRPSLA